MAKGTERIKNTWPVEFCSGWVTGVKGCTCRTCRHYQFCLDRQNARRFTPGSRVRVQGTTVREGMVVEDNGHAFVYVAYSADDHKGQSVLRERVTAL